MTALVALLLDAAKDNPLKARMYVQARGKVEQAMRHLGQGYRTELKRPESVGLPVQELKPEPEREYFEPTGGDFMADNLPETDEPKPQPQKRRK